MNKWGKTEYRCTNRQSTRRDKMIYNNLVHDTEYTFADEYYSELQTEYYGDLLKDIDDDVNKKTN